MRECKAGCKPPGVLEKAASACSKSFSLKPWPLKSSSRRVWDHFWVNRGLPSLARVSWSDMPYRPRCSCSSSEMKGVGRKLQVGKGPISYLPNPHPRQLTLTWQIMQASRCNPGTATKIQEAQVGGAMKQAAQDLIAHKGAGGASKAELL